jgi:hypothetical protein
MNGERGAAPVSRRIRLIAAGVVIACLMQAGMLAAATDAPRYSGYLGSESVYDSLKTVEIRSGVVARRWIGPDFNALNFDHVLVDDVVFYPEARPGPRVSSDTLQQVQQYLSGQLRRKVGDVLAVAKQPALGVLRMQTAITALKVRREGLLGHGALPVGALFAGEQDVEVRVFVETRFSDSRSGEIVGLSMRELDGTALERGNAPLTLADMKESLDQATDDAAANLAILLTNVPEDPL